MSTESDQHRRPFLARGSKDHPLRRVPDASAGVYL